MKKYCIAALLMMSLAFSYGVRPTFSIGTGWSFIKPEGYSGSHFYGFGIGTTAPFSQYIGIGGSLFWVDFDLSEEGVLLGGTSSIGFIEMIPTTYVSPFFTQGISLTHLSGGSVSITSFGFAVGVGVEFLSSSYVSPYISGGFNFYTSDGYQDFGFGAGIGVRFSWIK